MAAGKSVGAPNGSSHAQLTLGLARFVGSHGGFYPPAYARDVHAILALAVGVSVFLPEAARGQAREAGDGGAEG